MKDIRESTAVQFPDYDAEDLLEQSVMGDSGMADHTFLQMTNGTIKEIDPVDETMSMLEKHRRFRPNSYADVSYHRQFQHSPEYIKQTRDNDEVTAYMEEFAKTDA